MNSVKRKEGPGDRPYLKVRVKDRVTLKPKGRYPRLKGPGTEIHPYCHGQGWSTSRSRDRGRDVSGILGSTMGNPKSGSGFYRNLQSSVRATRPKPSEETKTVIFWRKSKVLCSKNTEYVVTMNKHHPSRDSNRWHNNLDQSEKSIGWAECQVSKCGSTCRWYTCSGWVTGRWFWLERFWVQTSVI